MMTEFIGYGVGAFFWAAAILALVKAADLYAWTWRK